MQNRKREIFLHVGCFAIAVNSSAVSGEATGEEVDVAMDRKSREEMFRSLAEQLDIEPEATEVDDEEETLKFEH